MITKNAGSGSLLETGEAGRRLQVSAVTVRQLAAKGVLRTAGRTLRGVWLFHEADVERLREERAVRTAALRKVLGGEPPRE